MIVLEHYIKNLAIEKRDYFEEEIDKEIVLISTFDNISFSTSLAISTPINSKTDGIVNKMCVNYIVYLG